MTDNANIDWSRLDTCAIISNGGIACIRTTDAASLRQWLQSEGYQVLTWDLGSGLTTAIPVLSRLLRWEDQFGYELNAERRGLDAVRDGLCSDHWHGPACALELVGAEAAWREDAPWMRGFLSIAEEHTRECLWRGWRYFTMLVLPEHSPLLGTELEHKRLPHEVWPPRRQLRE